MHDQKIDLTILVVMSAIPHEPFHTMHNNEAIRKLRLK